MKRLSSVSKTFGCKRPIFIKALFIFLAAIFSASTMFAQTGGIRGVVVDAQTKETLVGAAVVIQSTYQGITTNLDGEYELSNLAPGNYNIQISFISYDPVIIENVKVEANKYTSLNVPLGEATQQLQGVSVVARRVQHTDVSLISSIKTADLVVSGVSAQQISRSQDRDASQVVRRIPGVTIVDNRFVVVRGLSERYNAVMLNDLYAQSMEDDIRSFSFDIIPSGQLERIMVFKSPSADLPGDFAGGAVKIYTKSIPDKSGVEVSYSLGYEPGTTLKDFYSSERYAGHWSGFNRGHYDLPDIVPADIRSVKNDEELSAIGQSFKNNWVAQKNTAMFNQSAAVSAFFTVPISSMTFGHITSVNYSNSNSYEEIDRYDYNAYDLVNNKSLPLYWFNDHRFSQNIRVGALHNYGLRINANHSIDFNNLFNQIARYEYVDRGGNYYDNYNPSNHGFKQLYQSLYSGQFNGKHNLFNKNTEINWIAGYGFTKREMPDYKNYRSDLTEIGGDRRDASIYVPFGSAQPHFLGRFFSIMDENAKSLSINITQKVNFSNAPQFAPVIKAGVYIEEKDRIFKARNIGYAQEIGFNQEWRNLPINELFRPENITADNRFKIDEQSNPHDSYDASGSLKAYYISFNIPFASKFSLVTGLRIEDYKQRLVSATTSMAIDTAYISTDFLSSFNLSYSISDKALFRAAYGKTINRPEFRERAAFSFYDFNHNSNKKGNRHLHDALVDNFDLRWEYYPSMSEMINFGVFYKKFEKPIETLVDQGSGTKNFYFANAESAVSYGLELDLRKSLSGILISQVLDDFSIIFNAALIKSEVKTGSKIGHNRNTDNRPMQGQSPYILNTGVYYSNDDKGWQVNASYNIIGERIYSTGFWSIGRQILEVPDAYEMPRNLVDLTVSKTFTNNLTVRVGVSDLLNQKTILLQDANQDGKLDKNTDQILQSYRPGSLFTLSVGFKL